MNKEELKIYEVVFECDGSATGKMRSELDVRMVKPLKESFVLATDEGKFHGGDGTAPPPLALFIAGLVGCVMTQTRAFARRMNVQIKDLKVSARVEWEARQYGIEPYETAPKSFQVDVDIDSESAIGDVKKLVEVAKKACFIEATLSQSNEIRHRLRNGGGDWVDL